MFMKSVSSPLVASKVMALDALRGPVMMADNDLNITYVNPSAIDLLRAAEPDLQQELPRFSMATLIGSNFDVFHKNPDHQRTMLAQLEKPHEATIRVGPHTFDLLVTPLTEAGKRLGFVVEWEDAAQRLKNMEHAARDVAIARHWAVIEFAPDGTILGANELFLNLLGYTLAEIKGQRHRMFVDPTQLSGTAYEEFWASTTRNHGLSGRFRRLGKNGKVVWIDGRYNPIYDQTGKMVKVVKFATDITALVTLLDNLTVSLDHIDSSVSRSMDEAGSASAAASETLGHVQSVAASAEQLAASIQDIAQSMAKSRVATENMSAQALAVGQSTDAMASAAQAMNGIVGLIRTVASQINLLALNATIEAARAGDAGKGFAVVASEVKNLAIQAAKATEQITTEIDGLQTISANVASNIATINTAMSTVREQVTLTASAVEEQTAVTNGMSSSLHTVSSSMGTVTSSIAAIVTAVGSVADTVNTTKVAASKHVM